MLAILGGLGAASCWAAGTLCTSRASKHVTSGVLLAWVAMIGLVATLPFLVLGPPPPHVDRTTMAWLLASGLGNIGGLLFVFGALRIGQVGVVAPIVSTEGAIAALIAVASGEPLAAASAVALTVIVAGVALAGRTSSAAAATTSIHTPRHTGRATLLALGAAACFGLSIYSTGRNSGSLPVAWAILPPRALGVALVAIPLALRGRLRIPRSMVPLAAAAGILEVIGFGSFTLGARHGIAVSAVLASQFAAITAVAAYFLFGERLERLQIVGVLTVLGGVACLAALQA